MSQKPEDLFHPRAHSGRRELTPNSCPLTSTYALCHICMHTHAYRHTHHTHTMLIIVIMMIIMITVVISGSCDSCYLFPFIYTLFNFFYNKHASVLSRRGYFLYFEATLTLQLPNTSPHLSEFQAKQFLCHCKFILARRLGE